MKKQKTDDKGQKAKGRRFYFTALLLCCSTALLSGCKKKEEVKPPPPPPKPPVIEVPPPKYETYYYADMGRRDPFVSLGEGVSKKGEIEVVIEEKKEEEKTGLEEWALSGFIWDKNERVAIIKAQEEAYLFAYGTLSDRNGEPVPDIKAKIKDSGILLVKNKKDIFLKMEERALKEGDMIQ